MPKNQWLVAVAIIVMLVAVVAYVILTHSIGLGGATNAGRPGY